MAVSGKPTTGNPAGTALAVALTACAASANAQDTASSLRDAIAGGEVNLEFRYRMETVNQAGFDEDALASALKSRISFRPLDIGILGFFFELDNVSYLGEDEFNSTRNGKTNFPIVADPDRNPRQSGLFRFQERRRIHQAGDGSGSISMNNASSAAWRGDITNKPWTLSPWSTIHWAILISNTAMSMACHGFSGRIMASPLTITTAIRTCSTQVSTWAWGGVSSSIITPSIWRTAPRFPTRPAASASARPWTAETSIFPVNLEYARQGDHGDNPIAYDANFLLLEGGVDTGELRLMLGHQQFGGDPSEPQKMFRTPLATLHRYQGWTDRFLTIPGRGVENTYLTLTTRGLTLSWHDFSSGGGHGALRQRVGRILAIFLQ